MSSAQSLPPITSLPLMDLRVNPLSDAEVAALVGDAIGRRAQYIIANHNLHSMYLWYRDENMRRFYDAATCTNIDGMALIILANLFGLRLGRSHRSATLDFFPLLAPEAVRRGWRIFYLGSKPGVDAQGAATLRTEYPGLQIKTHHGYFNVHQDSAQNRQVVDAINAYDPHILLVGMGMPRQEAWILENYRRLRANAIFPVGGFMDYMAGEIPTAPRWLASLYLEWFYRLLSEPRRLSYRYLIEPWFVFGQVAKYFLGSRQPYPAPHESRKD